MPAGRPRHQDVLTPREWDVLDLLRQDLTNEQIASRLAIAPDTAKFHVSEILSKLGVQTRQEAAAWRGQPRRVFTLAPLAALLRKSTAHQLAGVGVAAGVAAVLLLATGIALMNARDRDPQTSVAPTPVPGEERFAPDGRTGIAEVDAAIDALLHDDGDALNRAFSGITAREELRIQAEAPGSYTTDTLEVTAARWTARLAAARKSLYAVLQSEPLIVDVVLAIDSGGAIPEAWIATLQDGQFRALSIFSGYMPAGITFSAVLSVVSLSPSLPSLRSIPSPADQYEKYLVLPPKPDLPQPPPGHPLSVRTGNAGVDRLIAMLQAGDVTGLQSSLADGSQLPFRDSCEPDVLTKSRQSIQTLLATIAGDVVGVRAIAVLPVGYEPAGEHLVVLQVRQAPYRWEIYGLVEQDSRITGVVQSDCAPSPPPSSLLFPPGEYLPPLVPPPAAAGTFDAARRSGIPIVDSVLDALQSRDAAALETLFDFTPIACVPFGPAFGQGEYGPACRQDEAPGTVVDGLPGSVCHGLWSRRGAASQWVLGFQDASTATLFAVVPITTPDPLRTGAPVPAARMSLHLASSDGPPFALSLNERGITGVSRHCGPTELSYDPQEWRVASGPTQFLLPPP